MSQCYRYYVLLFILLWKTTLCLQYFMSVINCSHRGTGKLPKERHDLLMRQYYRY